MTPTHALRRHRSLAVRVWILAGIAVCAALAIVLVHAQLVSGLSEDRERMTRELERSRDALAAVRSNMLVVNASIERLLARDGSEEEFDVGEVQRQLTRCRSVLEGANLLPRSLRAQLEYGEGLLADVRDWSAGNAENRVALDELTSSLSQRLGALRSELADVAEAPNVGPDAAARLALRLETATLRAAALELRLADDAADAIELRAKVIEPSLARMQTAAAALSDARAAALLGAMARSLRDDLVGAAVPGREGGLHAARMRSIELEGRHDRLEASAARVLEAVNAELEHLIHGTQEGMVEMTERTESALVRARLWTNVIGGFVLAIFLGVCWYMSRAIQRQVSMLEATTEDLSRVNAAHEDALKRVSVLTSAMECAADAIVIADASGKITWVNPAFSRMTGYERDEVLGTPARFASDPVASGDATTEGEDPWPTLNAGVAWRGEMLARRKGGGAYVQQGTITPVKDEHGAIACFVAIERDATSEHEAQNALEEAHAEMELVLRSLSAILIGVTLEGRVSIWNRHAESILGQPSVRAHGTLLQDLGLNWDLAGLVAGVRRCVEERKEVRLNEVRFARPDGTNGILGVTLSPMFDAKEELRGCLVVARDITSIRSLESQLARAQKLEAIGQLAAGIAHEINTPTQFISDNTRFVRESIAELAPVLAALAGVADATAEDEHATLARIAETARKVDLEFLRQEVPQALDQSLEGLERISTIVLAMKKFSHPGSGKKDAVDLNQSVQNTITVARNEWRYVAEVETAFDAALPRPQCFEQEINQVVLNMIVNAAHAIAERARKTPGHKGLIRVATRAHGDQVAIDVADNGCGIPPEVRDRIFDPFFTTKEVGKGTGQGLAIAHDVVVKKHGGRIEVQSEPDQGTTFTVWLPVEDRGKAA